MKYVALLSLALTLLLPSASNNVWADEQELTTTRVLIQGKSASELQQLVEQSGGTVTHELHIINAVGAQVTAEQLELILKSPLVTRFLDDLSTRDTPEEAPSEAQDSCEIGGGLELHIEDAAINWTLYNKSGKPAQLEALNITWPKILGDIQTLTLGAKKIDSALLPQEQDGSLSLKFTAANTIEAGNSVTLRASFLTTQYTWRRYFPMQRDFKITAEFGDECSTKLIPGYANNHEDSYFPTIIEADALHRHGITGKGVTVAIIDSGLWETDVLRLNTKGIPRIVARYDAIKNITDKVVFDESGHGTHMASVLAHSGEVTKDGTPTGSFKGVAPDVDLVAVKAFDIGGHGDFLDIVRGVQFVVDHREALNIKVLNLSFSARPRWDYWLDPINQAVMQAWASGITVVAAAGNEGPDPMTIGSPGNLPYIITVGAVTDSWTLDTRDDDYIPDFSSQGPTPNAHIKPDIVAPGGHMTGLTRPGSTLTKDYPDYLLRTGEFVMTGTSQASALVSGMVALLLQLEPDLTPDDIKCKLMTSAEPAINRDGLLAYSPFQQGSGYANVSRAITLGQRGCGNADLDIVKDINNTDHYQGPAIVLDNGNPSLPGLDSLVSPTPSMKGMSDTRKWGVKAHIERKRSNSVNHTTTITPPFDWEISYQEEKLLMERLATEPQQ